MIDTDYIGRCKQTLVVIGTDYIGRCKNSYEGSYKYNISHLTNVFNKNQSYLSLVYSLVNTLSAIYTFFLWSHWGIYVQSTA